MEKYCVFDLETTGLPIRKSFNNYYHSSELDKYDGSRIVSFAWAICSGLDLITSRYYIVKPVDFDINPNSVATKINGITQEIADKNGLPLLDILKIFASDITEVKTLIAHNIQFDKHVLLSELHRISYKELIIKLNSVVEFCTMKESRSVVKIPSKYKAQTYKYPRLSELYKYFFKKEFSNQHRADADVNACLFCYQKLKGLL